MMYNNSISLTVSQAQSDYCEKERLDPEEPTCARVIVTGQVSSTKDFNIFFSSSEVTQE